MTESVASGRCGHTCDSWRQARRSNRRRDHTSASNDGQANAAAGQVDRTLAPQPDSDSLGNCVGVGKHDPRYIGGHIFNHDSA